MTIARCIKNDKKIVINGENKLEQKNLIQWIDNIKIPNRNLEYKSSYNQVRTKKNKAFKSLME